MPNRKLYMTATGCSGIISIQTETSHSTISANCSIECTGTNLDLSDEVTIDAGYSDNHGILFHGYVKKIERMTPDKIYKVTVHDPLIRAVDYFIASDDPENPLTYHNILDRDLINAILGEAGLPNVVSPQVSPTFSMGTNPDGAKFNLQSAADVLQFMCSITGRLIYADNAGDIYYVDRKPYVDTGDTPTLTFIGGNGGNIIDATYEKTNDRIRNVVKVYGKTPLTARASASSPYLVVDQTSVIAHELLDTPEICNATANINLSLLNRLQESYELTLEGDPNIQARKCATITDSFLGVASRPIYLYRVGHNLSEAGYTTTVTGIP